MTREPRTWKPSPDEWRTTPRPLGWKATCARIQRRDHHRCTWIEGPRNGGWPIDEQGPIPENHPYKATSPHRCNTPSTDTDHAGRNDDHRDEALRALCEAHHRRRTGQQGAAARNQHTRLRPIDTRHPGSKT